MGSILQEMVFIQRIYFCVVQGGKQRRKGYIGELFMKTILA